MVFRTGCGYNQIAKERTQGTMTPEPTSSVVQPFTGQLGAFQERQALWAFSFRAVLRTTAGAQRGAARKKTANQTRRKAPGQFRM